MANCSRTVHDETTDLLRDELTKLRSVLTLFRRIRALHLQLHRGNYKYGFNARRRKIAYPNSGEVLLFQN
jgi:hypothetical protein